MPNFGVTSENRVRSYGDNVGGTAECRLVMFQGGQPLVGNVTIHILLAVRWMSVKRDECFNHVFLQFQKFGKERKVSIM